jgi:DHA1 family bicyclomycin/chloramphenicol resistance-like MFS transporter
VTTASQSGPSRRLLILLAACGALGSMSIHMFVPAMPAVARDLNASAATVQLAVTLYLIGIGSGQLVAGPAADRLGRRPVLLAGLAMFVVGAACSAAAPTAPLLLAARFVQAIGGAAGIVVARAIVADLSLPANAAARQAALTTIVLISPAISPMIGAGVAAVAGWRFIFVMLASLGSLAILISFRAVRETAAPGRVHSSVAKSYARLLSNGRFRRYALAITGTTCGLYIFLSASAFLLIGRYGLSPEAASLCYFLVAACGIAGTFTVGFLERRGGAFRVAIAGAAAGGALMLALALSGADNPYALMGPMLLVGFAAGIAAPSGMAGAMHSEEGLAGTGASLVGALQMLGSGAAASVVAHLGKPTFPTIAAGVFISAAIAFVAAPKGHATAFRRAVPNAG